MLGFDNVDYVRDGFDVETASPVIHEPPTLHVDLPPALVNVEVHERSECSFIDSVVFTHNVEEFRCCRAYVMSIL